MQSAAVASGTLATVHDLASLRLHPDGTRANSHRSRIVKDARGNVLADNAAKRRKRPKPRQSEAGTIDFNEAIGEGEGIRASGKGKEKAEDVSVDEMSEDAATKELKDPRARKRRRYEEGYLDFLDIRDKVENNGE
jgi:hypothetical protein